MDALTIWHPEARPALGPASLDEEELAFVAAIAEVPKVELHLHVEGAIHPDLRAALGGPANAEAPTRGQADAGDFGSFFAAWIDNLRPLFEPAGYPVLVRDFTRRLVQEKVAWAEVFISPPDIEKLTEGTVSFEQSLRWWVEAFESETDPAVEVRLIVDLVRLYGVEQASRRLEVIETVRGEPGGSRLVGIGLGGPEPGYPLAPFAELYKKARSLGLLCVTHAGEQTGAEDVAQAVEDLRVQRIGHGLALRHDEDLYRRVCEEGIGVELCPASNLCTGALADLGELPLRRWLDDGLLLSINTDDPSLFRTSLALEFLNLRRGFGLSLQDVGRLLENAAKTSTMPADVRQPYLQEIQAWAGNL